MAPHLLLLEQGVVQLDALLLVAKAVLQLRG